MDTVGNGSALGIVSRIPGLLAAVPGKLRSVDILHRAGMTSYLRPDIGIRSLIAVRKLGPVAGAVRVSAERDGGALGLVDERGELTYRQLDERSNALTRAWQADGLGVGAVIGVLCRDHRGLVESMLAAAKLGARALLMNTGFSAPQLTAVAERENVRAIVCDQEFTGLLEDVPQRVLRYVAWVDDAATLPAATSTLDTLVAGASDARLPAPAEPGGMTLLTSGTTGTPKGAPRQIRSALAAAEFLDRIPLRSGESTFLAAPIFHGTGLSQFVLTLGLGSTVVTRRRFDPEETLRALQRYRCTALVVVPTMLQRILDLGDEVLNRYDTSALRVLFTAGSALAPETGNRATEHFGDVIYNLYGSTEVAVATVATPQDWRQAPGTAGRPPHGCRVHLYDTDGRQVTAPGAQGRVFVSSGLAFTGYTGGGSKEMIDGLLSTGDIGHFDADGLLFIDGRDDEMIVSGGENVYPVEVESLLLEHPGVTDAAVIGVPDTEFGQRLRAFVVRAPGAEVDEGAVKEHVRRNLARYKVPRDVRFIPELPRNATGKILRTALSELD